MTNQSAMADLSRTIAEQAATIEVLTSRVSAIEAAVGALATTTGYSDAIVTARVTQVEVPRL